MPRIGLFVTCLVDVMRPSIGFAAVALLEAAGCAVTVPRAQTCCGQPAWNAGAGAHTAAIARQVIDAFEGFDAVVVPSASCAGMIRNHYPEALAADPHYAARARALGAKTFELVSYLIERAQLKEVKAKLAAKACYHTSCSALREMGITETPHALLDHIEGLSVTPLADAQVCCGFGGLFSVKYPEISERMADDKLADAMDKGAELIIAPDLGCLLHLAGRAARRGLRLEFRHVAEVLAGRREPGIGAVS